MNAARWKGLVSPLLGREWAISRRLAYVRPVGQVVFGLFGESSNRRGFYVWAVQMPLYVPDEHVNLSWSTRVGNPARAWQEDDQALIPALRDAIDNIERSYDQTVTTAETGRAVENVLMQEARAYGLLLRGDVGGSLECLKRVERYDPKYDWEVRFHHRASNMLRLVEAGSVEEARHRLAEWRLATACALGIET